MRPRAKFPEGTVDRLGEMMKAAKTKADFQRVQCVWLREAFGLELEEIARIVMLSPNTVRCMHSRYLKQGEDGLRGVGRGGRRREHLTVQEEDQVLRNFFTRSKRGEVLVVSEVKEAYEEAVGQIVHLSTVYRVLARHGWRKIVPRPRHPRSDPDAINAFKKTPGDRSGSRQQRRNASASDVPG